ncbi:MAG: dipeptidase [Clostridia bacterium]|nr:dipeptidase [Clostridia bacterium]
MKFIDMHCDTLMKLLFNPEVNTNLFSAPECSVDFDKMKRGDQLAQFFAVFLPPRQYFDHEGKSDITDEMYIAEMRKILLTNVEKYNDIIAMAYSAEDVEKNLANGKMSAILTMEEGRAVDGKMENIKRFYDDGFRAIALTWNFVNCFGSPNSTDESIMKAGLTPFGKEAVEYMQTLGMLVDVSHLSEGGFWDVVDVCKKPFIASHSNCRALSSHQRNLWDEQIKALANKGGVSGINFAPAFLNADQNDEHSTAAAMAKHILHFINVGGIECVGMGTDFDGIGGKLEIADSSMMGMLVDELAKNGLSEDMIEKVFYKNVLRVMRDAL